MREFSPLDLIQAHPWSSSFFTTYALSLSFFEAVVLDSLVRQRVGQNVILADVEGVRAALAEHGARNVGRSYALEPVAVAHGCFHSKLMVLTSHTEAHITIGSGNLTFGGWGSNLESIEHLHASFAADAFYDVADFLESLATAKTVKHAAIESCAALAEELRRFGSMGQRSGRIRVIHSIERPILDQLEDYAGEFGGAQRITVGSPFFDNGLAIDALCGRLRVDHAFVHVHDGGSVRGTVGCNWPANASSRIEPTAIELFAELPPRTLHAKVIEIVCRHGRVVISGSANATMAALGQGRNVELCVVRLENGERIPWRLGPAARPSTDAASVHEAPSHDPSVAGVLRAILRSEQLDGWILTAFPCGFARVFRMTRSGSTEIGEALVSSDGRFLLGTRDLEQQAWLPQRLILRVESSTGAVAEGFVSFASFAEITRCAGEMAPRLFAVLAGTETPDDIAAMMSWFYENPKYLSPETQEGGWPGASAGVTDVQVPVGGLLEVGNNHPAIPYPSNSLSAASWRRFLAQILASFREHRGPISANSDSDDGEPSEDRTERPDAPPRPREDPSAKRAMHNFDQLFVAMLKAVPKKRDLATAFRVTQYVCDRLEPDALCVKNYFDALLAGLLEYPLHDEPLAYPLSDDAKEIASGAILISLAIQTSSTVALQAAARLARRRLLRIQANVGGEILDTTLVQGFRRILAPTADLTMLWDAVLAVRTVQEEVRAYRATIPSSVSKADFPLLGSTPEWSVLAGPNRKGVSIMSRYDASCPVHYMALPLAEAARFRQSGMGVALNCCQRVLLCEEY